MKQFIILLSRVKLMPFKDLLSICEARCIPSSCRPGTCFQNISSEYLLSKSCIEDFSPCSCFQGTYSSLNEVQPQPSPSIAATLMTQVTPGRRLQLFMEPNPLDTERLLLNGRCCPTRISLSAPSPGPRQNCPTSVSW